MAVIPKSSKSDRIVENFSIFDFVLDPEDMAALGALDKVGFGVKFECEKWECWILRTFCVFPIPS